jgi:hypothetical protein
MGTDASFLAELLEIREEIVMSAIADQRSQLQNWYIAFQD